LRRLKAIGRIVAPRRGFYVLVPLEYRATGAPPATWFIDDLMKHLDRPYYVGLLTAAGLHGASPQAPQVFQVVTDLPRRPLTVGRVRIAFIRGRVASTPVRLVNTPTGTMRVSTPEGTAFDLVRHVSVCGGLNHVATVLGELAEEMDEAALPDAARGVELTVVQRTGYLLDLAGAQRLTEPLARWLADRRTFLAPLRPDLSSSGAPRDGRWHVMVNDDVEPDA